MSNIALFSSGSAVPEYLRGVADVTTKDLAGGSSFKQISIKGGVWRMMIGGEEVAKNEDRAMNLVVLGTSPGVTRTFYEGSYEEGVATPPACWSAEGVAPEAAVKQPQAKSCATCKQNIAGSGQGDSRACRFSKRVAVVLEGDIAGNVYRMNVPAKSLFGKAEGEKMPLQAFGKFLAGHGIPITGIVTEARFDTAEAVPVLKFKAVRPLSKAEWEVAKEQSQSEDALQALEMTIITKEPAALPALPAAFSAPEPAAKPVKAEPAPVKEPTKVAKAAKPVVAAPAPTKDIAAVLDSWGDDDE